MLRHIFCATVGILSGLVTFALLSASTIDANRLIESGWTVVDPDGVTIESIDSFDGSSWTGTIR